MAFSTRFSKGKTNWENCFLFPHTGIKNREEPICYWDGAKWTMMGRGPIAVLSDDKVMDDPIAALYVTPRTAKIMLKSGNYASMPRDYVEVYIWNGTTFNVASPPSVYPVFVNGKHVKLLACFGYRESDGWVMLFGVRDPLLPFYGAHMIHREDLFQTEVAHDDAQAIVPKMPDYSPAARFGLYNPETYKVVGGAIISKDIAEEVQKRLKEKRDDDVATLSRELAELVTPTSLATALIARVENGVIKTEKVKKSKLLQMNSFDEIVIAGQACMEQILKEQEANFPFREGGGLPMPKGVVLAEKPTDPNPFAEFFAKGKKELEKKDGENLQDENQDPGKKKKPKMIEEGEVSVEEFSML